MTTGEDGVCRIDSTVGPEGPRLAHPLHIAGGSPFGLPFVQRGASVPCRAMPPYRYAVRSFVFLLVGTLLFGAGPLLAQSQGDDVLERVEAGLESGDPALVLEGAATRVEVVLFGQGGMYRRAQAAHVLRDFFRRYPPDRVAFSERSSSDEGRAAIWRYFPQDGGAPLGVRVLHREDGDTWELASVRVEQLSSLRTGSR